MPRAVKNAPGDVIGEWTLLARIPGRIKPRIPALWLCRCACCGQELEVQASNLVSGMSQSCGRSSRAANLTAYRLSSTNSEL